MIRNSASAWGSVSKLAHWLAAALVLFLIIHGWWMTEFVPRAARFGHYSWHASVGYATLALIVLRLLWRWLNTVPEFPASMAEWEQTLARVAHWGLYLLTLAAAVSGWALAGTLRRPLDATFLGIAPMPSIVTNRALHDVMESAHALLSWTLAALVAAHVASALYHWIIRKDDIMQRMLPSPGSTEAVRG